MARGAVTTEDLALAADSNLLAVTRAWALACATGDVWEDDGLLIAASGNELRSFNVAYLARCERELLLRACDWLRARTGRFRLRIREGVAIDDGAIAAAGLEPQGGIPSLVLAPLPHNGPGTFDVRPVQDTPTLHDHVEVVASAFGWRPDLPAQVFTARLAADPAWRGFVGYAEDHPVASSQLFVHQGIAGIYYVATLPGFRRRGFGEAVTAHAIAVGRSLGCTAATLQASPMGLPIYERMGFQRVSHYHQYIPKEA